MRCADRRSGFGSFPGCVVAIVLARPVLLVAEEPAAPTLDFMGPSSFVSKPNTFLDSTLTCVIEDWANRTPIEAWSIAVAGEGPRISGLSIIDTDTERALAGGVGFGDMELTSGPENEGAVQAVILPTTSPVVLSERQRFSMLVLDLEAQVPPNGVATGAVRYVSALTASSGVVRTVVLLGGEETEPLLKERSVSLRAEPDCPVLNIGFSAENLRSEVPFEGIIGGEQGGGHVAVHVPEGQPGSVHIFANIVSRLEGNERGAQGWALSIACDGEIEISRGNELGTAGDKPPIGLYSGFVDSEIVDPVANGGQRGIVSAAVLSFTDPSGTLPPVGTYSVLDMTVEDRGPHGSQSSGVLRAWSGLVASGAPVSNLVLVDGATRLPCDLDRAVVTVVFERTGEGLFFRGNANDDQKVDIADPVWILNDLFLGGPPTTCLDAADANDDGGVDVSDPVYLLSYQFLGGPKPPAPFPDCGLDPDLVADGLGCADDQNECD